jgi:hypothetical protein
LNKTISILFFSMFHSVCYGDNVILKSEFSIDKYAIVRVYNVNGTINREYKIDSNAYASFKAQVSSVPIGVTPQEWQSGRTIVMGKGFEVGDAYRSKSGWIKIKYAETIVNGVHNESFLYLSPSEYSGIVPNITVTATKMIEINSENSKRTAKYNKDVTSVTNGILVTK